MKDVQTLLRKHQLERRKEKKEESYPKKMTCGEYLEMVKQTPEVAQLAPARIYNAIVRQGVETIPENERWGDADSRYKFFSDQMFGQEDAHENLMRFLAAGARRTETGKRILLLMGPPAGGKSTIASMMKRGLEEYSQVVPLYAIEGCDLHEEPLHLLPRHLRSSFEETLGVKIEGDLCPQCRRRLFEEFSEKNEAGDIVEVRWEDVPVVRTSLSERGRVGISTFQPGDPKSQDISDLIGYEDVAKSARYGKADPRSYSLTGELEKGNRGMIEFIEMLKCDKKFLWCLISVAQEQVIKVQGSTFPQIYTDTVILSHTNQPEFEEFAQQKEPALHDRIYMVKVPYPLRVKDEKKVYEKLLRESHLSNVHISPYALDIVAMFTVLTRYSKSQICEDPVKKMKYYNGDRVQEDRYENPVDVRELREEGKNKGEGFFGISSRYAIDAINTALTKEGATCLTPRMAIRALQRHFEHHMGFSKEEVAYYKSLLQETKEGTVTGEYKKIVEKEVTKAFLKAYEDLAREQFEKYMRNVTAHCRKEKIQDPFTGRYEDPDENIMRSIEEMIGVTENRKDQFRQEVLVYKATEPNFDFSTYEPLQEAVEKKLLHQMKDTLSLVVSKDRPQSGEEKARAKDLHDTLVSQRGFCDKCAQEFIEDAARFLSQ
ncbi:MAG: protein prkA [Candidatus Paceibacterota bacterium]